MSQTSRKDVEANEIAFYASIYKEEAYNQVGNNLRLERELKSLISNSGLKNFGKVLSIGCGGGEFERLLAPYAERIIAIDLSPEAIELAKRKQELEGIKNITYKCQSFADLNLEEHFDVLVCIAFLHHVPESELQSFLDKVYKHLSSGGIFYSQDPNVNGILRKVGRIVLGKKYDKYHTPNERELDPYEIILMQRKSGFAKTKIKFIDLTLIPSIYMFKKGFSWLMYLSLFVDKIWSLCPFAKWSSGYALITWKD